jgi:citrate lyase beta subunit
MMGMLRVLSLRGDDAVTWSMAETETSVADSEASAAVREAERIFREQRQRGATAFRIVEGRSPVRIDEFDPQAEQIVMVPRVVGG